MDQKNDGYASGCSVNNLGDVQSILLFNSPSVDLKTKSFGQGQLCPQNKCVINKKQGNMKIKPFKSMNGKVFTATPAQLREEVFAEINANKVTIDRTPQFSREEIREAKKAWKKDGKRDVGVLDAILSAGKRRPRSNWKVTLDKTILS